jgi:capsular exopolysaccharide synthesis family protein
MEQGMRKYLNLAKQWWWLFIVSAIIPMVISYYFASKRPDLYQASATLMVGPSLFQDPDPDPREVSLTGTLAEAYSELAVRGPVIQTVIENLGLQTSPEGLATQINTRVNTGARLLEIQVVDTNPETAALIANALADELVRRSPGSGSTAPEQQAFVAGQIEELRVKIDDISSQIAELTAALSELTSAAEINEAEGRIEALEQVKSRYQTTYAELLSVYQKGSPNVLTVFDRALPPQWPIAKRTNLIVAAAGVAGVGLAIGAVLLMEYFDTSLRWGQEGEQSMIGLRVLGTIPQVAKRESLLHGDPLSPIADSIRALWVSTFLMHPDHRYSTLLLTSPRGSEGKSFLVANLAVALATAGNRVIVVDADMRKPTLHELFARPNIVGLSELLSGAEDADWEVSGIPLRQTSFENLRLLCAGRRPADPVALLASSRFSGLLELLKNEADIVLVDSPPVLSLPDAMVVASLAEGTIMVVCAGSTRREAARRTKELLLAQQDVNLLGVAVNRVKRKDMYDYYSSSYSRRSKNRGLRRWGQSKGDGWLTPAEVAEILGISQSMVIEWCKDGRLPATKAGLWWRVDVDRFAHMLEDTWDIKPST